MGLGQRSLNRATGQWAVHRPNPPPPLWTWRLVREACWAGGTLYRDKATWASSGLRGGENQSWAPSALCRNLFNGLGMCTFWLGHFHKGNFPMFQKKIDLL